MDANWRHAEIGAEERSKVEFKKSLAERVSGLLEFAKGDYKTKNNTEKRRKCVQCKEGFVGRADQQTCSDKCRKNKSLGK